MPSGISSLPQASKPARLSAEKPRDRAFQPICQIAWALQQLDAAMHAASLTLAVAYCHRHRPKDTGQTNSKPLARDGRPTDAREVTFDRYDRHCAFCVGRHLDVISAVSAIPRRNHEEETIDDDVNNIIGLALTAATAAFHACGTLAWAQSSGPRTSCPTRLKMADTPGLRA